MSISLLIIAHNEEQYLERCLQSVAHQSKQPDEIILVAHNCTDRTVEIAKKYNNIVVDEYAGPSGTVHARIRGFALAKRDVVACIDGDSWARPDWLEKLTRPFEDKQVVATGGFVLLEEFFGSILSYDFFFWSKWYRLRYKFYFWGANFAVRKNVYERIGGFTPLIELRKALDLAYWAEDLYLSLRLEKEGKVVFVPKARVGSPMTPKSANDHLQRSGGQRSDKFKLFGFFGI